MIFIRNQFLVIAFIAIIIDVYFVAKNDCFSFKNVFKSDRNMFNEMVSAAPLLIKNKFIVDEDTEIITSTDIAEFMKEWIEDFEEDLIEFQTEALKLFMNVKKKSSSSIFISKSLNKLFSKKKWSLKINARKDDNLKRLSKKYMSLLDRIEYGTAVLPKDYKLMIECEGLDAKHSLYSRSLLVIETTILTSLFGDRYKISDTLKYSLPKAIRMSKETIYNSIDDKSFYKINQYIKNYQFDQFDKNRLAVKFGFNINRDIFDYLCENCNLDISLRDQIEETNQKLDQICRIKEYPNERVDNRYELKEFCEQLVDMILNSERKY